MLVQRQLRRSLPIRSDSPRASFGEPGLLEPQADYGTPGLKMHDKDDTKY